MVQWWLVVVVCGGVVKALCRRKNEEMRRIERKKIEFEKERAVGCKLLA